MSALVDSRTKRTNDTTDGASSKVRARKELNLLRRIYEGGNIGLGHCRKDWVIISLEGSWYMRFAGPGLIDDND